MVRLTVPLFAVGSLIASASAGLLPYSQTIAPHIMTSSLPMQSRTVLHVNDPVSSPLEKRNILVSSHAVKRALQVMTGSGLHHRAVVYPTSRAHVRRTSYKDRKYRHKAHHYHHRPWSRAGSRTFPRSVHIKNRKRLNKEDVNNLLEKLKFPQFMQAMEAMMPSNKAAGDAHSPPASPKTSDSTSAFTATPSVPSQGKESLSSQPMMKVHPDQGSQPSNSKFVGFLAFDQ